MIINIFYKLQNTINYIYYIYNINNKNNIIYKKMVIEIFSNTIELHK